MESPAHMELKRIAARYLLECGCACVAMEVRCPRSKFRVDVAGYLDTDRIADGESGRQRFVRREARTIVVEAKASRADFIRDNRRADRLLRLRRHLQDERTRLENTELRETEPHLRRSGESLFPEMEGWDFSGSRSPTYRGVLRRLARAERRLYGETKFSRISMYRLADFLFLVAPAGLIRTRELPVGWGLLEVDKGEVQEGIRMPLLGGQARANVRIPSPELGTSSENRASLLRNIAAAATRSAYGHLAPGPDDSVQEGVTVRVGATTRASVPHGEEAAGRTP